MGNKESHFMDQAQWAKPCCRERDALGYEHYTGEDAKYADIVTLCMFIFLGLLMLLCLWKLIRACYRGCTQVDVVLPTPAVIPPKPTFEVIVV